MVFLTPLAPDITQAILEGRQPRGLKLATSPRAGDREAAAKVASF